MVLLVLLAWTIKMSYQTKHLNKFEISLKKNITQIFLNKNIYDCKRHIIGAYIRIIKFVRQKLWPICRTDGETDKCKLNDLPSRRQYSAIMSTVNFRSPKEKFGSISITTWYRWLLI